MQTPAFFTLASVFLGATLLAACGGSGESTRTDATGDELGVADNLDVQVVKAQASGQVSADSQRYDWKKCIFSDREANTTSAEFTSSAKADCTDMVAAVQGRPAVNVYHEPLAWIREDPSLSYVVMRHWCEELDVTVAVKAAAWDSSSFEGIGFYGHEPALNETPDEQRVFYAKSDPRLVRIGEATLAAGGEKAYLYRFGGAGPCEVNGSGDNPTHAFEFKPFVRYRGDIERWEAIESNHALRYDERWDRSGDLLR
jgi:hypothetical protein